MANTNCRPMPQTTVRHGNNFRCDEHPQAKAMNTTMPSRLTSYSCMARKVGRTTKKAKSILALERLGSSGWPGKNLLILQKPRPHLVVAYLLDRHVVIDRQARCRCC